MARNIPLTKIPIIKFNPHLKWVAAIWLFFGLIAAAFAVSGIRVSLILRDPAQVVLFPFYYGFLSNLGILVWAAGAFIPFYSSFLVRNLSEKSLLRWAGILTFVLLLDDFLLIHDEFFPHVLHLPQKLVYALYAIAFPIFFIRNFMLILKATEYWILALGIVFMGVSVLIDVNLLPGGIDVEDGFKIFGMIAYSYYWIITAKQMVSANSGSSNDRPSTP
jgi:hypothetical protein